MRWRLSVRAFPTHLISMYELASGFSLNTFLLESLRLLEPKGEGPIGNNGSPKVSIVSNSRKSLKPSSGFL